jgi:hypothetical protein
MPLLFHEFFRIPSCTDFKEVNSAVHSFIAWAMMDMATDVNGYPDNSSVTLVHPLLNMSVQMCFAAAKHCHHTMLIVLDAFIHL